MHNPELIPSLSCEHANAGEYWHESETCGLDDCAVIECLDCGEYATECEEVN